MVNKKVSTPKAITPRGRFSELREKAEKLSKKSKGWKAFFIGLYGVCLAAWVALVFFVIQYVVAFLFVKLLPKSVLGTNAINSIYQVVAYALALFVIIFVPWKVLKRKTTRDELGMRGLPTWTDVLLAPIGFIVTLFLGGALTYIMMAFLPEINWQQAQEVGYHGLYRASDFAAAFICLVVLAPLCEEIIFRGWLYGNIDHFGAIRSRSRSVECWRDGLCDESRYVRDARVDWYDLVWRFASYDQERYRVLLLIRRIIRVCRSYLR